MHPNHVKDQAFLGTLYVLIKMSCYFPAIVTSRDVVYLCIIPREYMHIIMLSAEH